MANGRQTAFTTRVVWFLVLLFLLITIISQLVIHFYNPLKTESARLYSASAFLPLTGIYVRDEKLVTYDGSGVISYVHSDGEKLAKTSVIAQFYNTQNDLLIQRQIDELENQIDILTDSEALIGSDNSQLQAFSNQIYEKHSQLLQYVSENNYSEAAKLKEDMLNLWCKKQIVSGTVDNFSEKKADLSLHITELNAQISQQPKDLLLNETGYFVSKVDGYEETLNYASITELDEEKIAQIIANPVLEVAPNVIGKFIADYKWKLVCVVDSENAKKIPEGSQVNIRLGSSAVQVQAKVDSLVSDADTGSFIAAFSCDILNSLYVGSRTVQFKVLFDNYSGIRIPSSAIRFDEQGNTGVYVKLGVELSFKKIRILVSEGDYAIVKDTSDEDGYISLYDTVVTEGIDLYDGKIVLQ